MSLRIAATIALCLLTAQLAAAQGVTFPRDRPNGPPPPLTGTGTIKGHVFDAQTGTALPRARVRLNWVGPAAPRPLVTTDESGAFAFAALPAGNFMLVAEKSTYLAARYPEATQTLRGNMDGGTLGEGQTLDVKLVMYHGGAITGRVVDAHGDPVESAQVQAMRLPKSGRGAPQNRGGTQTSDLGEYRLPRLEPGRYLVFVQFQRRDGFMIIDGPGGIVTGGVVASAGGPVAPVPVDLQPLPTFYPGVVALDQAQSIAVDRGVTVSGVDVMLAEGETFRVSGSVVDGEGQAVSRGGAVNVRPLLKDLPTGGFGMTGTPIGSEGTFQTRVPPGEYEIQARLPTMKNGQPVPGEERMGSVRLTVNGDVSGIVLQVGPGARASGKIIFEGDKPLPPVPAGGNGPRVLTFTSPDGSCRATQLVIAADWTFTLDGLAGTCVARAFGLPPWTVKAVTFEGKDLLDQPVTFASGQLLRDIEIVMIDKPTELALHVTDDQGSSTREYVALAFSTDKSKWSDTTSRYLRTLVPPRVPSPSASASGTAAPGLARPAGGVVVGAAAGGLVSADNPARREAMVGLPPGEYYVVAVNDVDVELSRDPDFLEQLSRGASRVSIAYGSPAAVTLKRIKVM